VVEKGARGVKTELKEATRTVSESDSERGTARVRLRGASAGMKGYGKPGAVYVDVDAVATAQDSLRHMPLIPVSVQNRSRRDVMAKSKDVAVVCDAGVARPAIGQLHAGGEGTGGWGWCCCRSTSEKCLVMMAMALLAVVLFLVFVDAESVHDRVDGAQRGFEMENELQASRIFVDSRPGAATDSDSAAAGAGGGTCLSHRYITTIRGGSSSNAEGSSVSSSVAAWQSSLPWNTNRSHNLLMCSMSKVRKTHARTATLPSFRRRLGNHGRRKRRRRRRRG